MKNKRIFIFAIQLILLFILFYFWQGFVFPQNTIGIIIFTCLLMLSFVTLFIEHYFTKPSDVLSSTIAILLLITPLKSELSNFGIWYNIYYFYVLILAAISVSSLVLLEQDKPSTTIKNKISYILKKIATHLGNGKWLFFFLFFLSLIFYVDSQSPYFIWLVAYSSIIIFIDPKKFIETLPEKNKKRTSDIGQVFGVQSKKVFLVKLFEKHEPVKIFDLVEFRYSMDDKDRIYRGLILDNYLLNQEQWIKVLVGEDVQKICDLVKDNNIKGKNIVYKIDNQGKSVFMDKFVGVISEDTTISKINFLYSSKIKINEGQLFEVNCGSTKVLYQLVQGRVKVEKLENKNETGFVVGEAVQLGVWNTKEGTFEKFGWLPDINSPVYLAEQIATPILKDDELQVGVIPNSNYPVILNKSEAVSHHLAILGVTGCGKSIFARNLIREIIKNSTKIICIDFTGEYKNKFSDLKVREVVSGENLEKIFNAIDYISDQMDLYPDKRDKGKIETSKTEISDTFRQSIEDFIKSRDDLAIFELPDVSNTTGILDYTKYFFKELFNIARKEKNFGKKICVVLEEAHTVIPEWSFIGTGDKTATSLVNNISQIALQGRKYNIGFIVIAQRTANVSKNVLTQCNSIIVFQEFDNTSKDFLSNYLGNEMVNILPNLKIRQAISVGKAFKSSVPLIFEVPEIIEPEMVIKENKSDVGVLQVATAVIVKQSPGEDK